MLAKRGKDVMQAESILEAMILTRRQSELAAAFAEAREKGPAWREGLKLGFSYLGQDRANRLKQALAEGLGAIGEKAEPADLFETAIASPPA